MKLTNINYRHVAALSAILSVILVQCAAFTLATPGSAIPFAPDPNLSSEQQSVERYFNDLVAYNRACSQLAARAQLRPADIDPVQRKSGDLKGRLSDVQRVAGEIIRKLKAANAWDDLDQKVLASVTDPRRRALFQPNGLKAALEEASTTLGTHASEISTPLDNLRRKLTSQTLLGDRSASVVLVGYGTSRPNPLISPGRVRCLVGKIRLGLIHRLGGTATDNTVDEVCCACACSGAANTGVSGTPCPQVQ